MRTSRQTKAELLIENRQMRFLIEKIAESEEGYSAQLKLLQEKYDRLTSNVAVPPIGWLPLTRAFSERLSIKQVQYGIDKRYIATMKYGGRVFFDPDSLLRYEETKTRK
jgi:hypothetical protein